jgi:hypothetical protein
MTDTRLTPQIPSQGWRQILSGRTEILNAYDHARQQSQSHKVEAYHGTAAEAAFRRWLAGFLPKRYGVTSGYVVSPGLSSREKTPHFDVIIYDQLESPILWIEGTADASTQGRSLAIPAEYVRAVLEVKSSFCARTVKSAVEHIAELSPLMSGIDGGSDPYKLYLPETFCCGMVFMELRMKDAFNAKTLPAVLRAQPLRGFFGGLVLRAENDDLPRSGEIMLTVSGTPMESPADLKTVPLTTIGISSTIEVGPNSHIGARLMWHEPAFSTFAFNLVAMVQGKYRPGYLSSFFGLGSSSLEAERIGRPRPRTE